LLQLVDGALEHDPTSALREAWELLRRDAGTVQGAITREYADRAVDPDRICHNARAMVATAEAACAVKRASSHASAWLIFLDSWRRAARDLSRVAVSASPPNVSGWSSLGTPDPTGLLQHARGELAGTGWPLAALSHWTLYWLRVPPASHKLAMPLAGWCQGGGFLAHLELTLLDSGKGELVEDPEIALRPLGNELLRTLEEQRERRTRKSVSWALTGTLPDEPLEGSSLGAAAAVGFALLDSGEPCAGGTLLLARVRDDDGLERVGDEKAKIDAAILSRTQPPIRRVGVAKNTALSSSDIAHLSSPGVSLELLADVSSAVAFASGRRALERYLEKVAQAVEENPEVYLGGRSPATLYVEPDVLKRVRTLPPPHQRDPAHQQEPEHRPSLPSEALDIGEEALWGERPQETEERVPWGQELDRIGEGQARVAVLTGPPGSGKTLLARITACALAQQAQEDLSGPLTKRADEVTLPVYVRLQALAGKHAPPGKTPDESLRGALRSVLRESGHTDEDEFALDYLAVHMHERRVWLFLDGLDEADQTDTLRSYFHVLNGWQCRVVIASRPHAYAAWASTLQSRDIAQYRLAPFTAQQATKFIDNWTGARASQIRDLFQRSHSVRQVSQSPLLLTLLCWVGEHNTLPPEVTRTELYDLVVRDLLGLRRGGGAPDLGRADALLPLMSEIALAWFQENKARYPITRRRLTDWIVGFRNIRPLPVSPDSGRLLSDLGDGERAECLLDELLSKRVLCPVDRNNSAFAFPHRSFAEYLAACALADRLKTEDSSRGNDAAAQVLLDR